MKSEAELKKIMKSYDGQLYDKKREEIIITILLGNRVKVQGLEIRPFTAYDYYIFWNLGINFSEMSTEDISFIFYYITNLGGTLDYKKEKNYQKARRFIFETYTDKEIISLIKDLEIILSLPNYICSGLKKEKSVVSEKEDYYGSVWLGRIGYFLTNLLGCDFHHSITRVPLVLYYVLVAGYSMDRVKESTYPFKTDTMSELLKELNK